MQNIEYYDKNVRDIIRYTNHDIIDTDYFQVSSLHLIEKYIRNNQNIEEMENIEDNEHEKIQLFNIIIEKMNINKKLNIIFMIIILIIYYNSYN